MEAASGAPALGFPITHRSMHNNPIRIHIGAMPKSLKMHADPYGLQIISDEDDMLISGGIQAQSEAEQCRAWRGH
jgi:hypothetical protein